VESEGVCSHESWQIYMAPYREQLLSYNAALLHQIHRALLSSSRE
jgi:hypothetical protein